MIIKFIGFFIAGLAVNLTPCVYPMLTVTASLFRPRDGETLKHSFAKALSYVLGIALTYSSLGYLAASTGKVFGAALQSSWVQGAVAMMMFILGLSMLGLFQLTVPSELLNRLSGLRKANYLGLFASGMLVGIFAAPCIGPPVLALLAAVADNGNPQYGFLVFFIFSLGLGLPYLLLGTFSSLITKLPKAGNWLIWVEKFFGMILIGFGIFYLSLALHLHLFHKGKDMIWQPYSEVQLQAAIHEHKPVIIDFFAEWCLGCHELDSKVFSDPQIRKILLKVKAFRVDATNINSPEASNMIDRYKVIGLPTIIFIDANGSEMQNIRVEGSASVKEFNKSLQIWIQQTGGKSKN